VRDDADREKRLDGLRRTVEVYGWRLHAFVLMPNHDHLFVEPPEATLAVSVERCGAWRKATRNCSEPFNDWNQCPLIPDPGLTQDPPNAEVGMRNAPGKRAIACHILPGTPKMVFIGCQKRNVVAVPAVARENRPPDGRPPGITYLRRNSKGGGLVELLYAGTGFMHIQRLLQDGT